MSDDNAGFAAAVFGLLGFAIGLWIGALWCSSLLRGEAIRHNAAHYDAVTAEFKWNSPAVEVVK